MLYPLKTHPIFKAFAHFLIVSLVFNPVISHAQNLPITSDGSTNTQVTQTASGIDQINIAAPNSSGLSHNKFTDYNVNSSGQIINNFSGNIAAEVAAGSGSSAVTQTQIGGLVTANSNLANSASAKVILNEVTSANISQLRGYVEIAGSKADLILANPNGITCAGCGFINTSRLLMIAGSSNFDASGNLGFNLKEQANPNLYVPLITIDGLGLDATQTTATEIISSSVKLLSTIYGSENNSITIKTGEGNYDHATKEITGGNSQNNSEPVFAIDAAALAKIQAGQIYLIATKHGVGVKMESEILASQTLNIDANGDVYYKNLAAGEAVNLKSTQEIQAIDSSAEISAPVINLATNVFTNYGAVSANILNIKNSGTINNDGNLEALNLTLTDIANVNNSGIIYGQNSLNISANNLANSLSGNIYSPQDYTIALTGLLANSGLIISGNNLTIAANSVDNGSSAIIASLASSLNLVLTNDIQNNGQLFSNSDFNLTAAGLDNSGVIKAFGKNIISADSISNQSQALIFSNSNSEISAATFTNSGSVLSNGKFDLTSAVTINNNEIFANGDVTLTLNDSFTNTGQLSSLAALNIHGTSTIINSNSILGEGNLSITASSLSNSNSIQSNSDLSLNLASLANTGNSLIFATNDLTIYATNISNQNTKPDTSSITSGIVAANGAANIFTDYLNNNTGLIAGKSTFVNTLNAASVSLSNDLGAFISTAEIILDLGNIDYTITGTVSASNIDITANNITNQGNVTASDYIKLNAAGNIINGFASGDNSDVQLASGTYINLTAKNNINNYATISATSDLTLTSTAGAINNYNIIKSGSGTATINAQAGSFSNAFNISKLTAANNLTFNLANDLNNYGEISSANNLTNNSNGLYNYQTALIWSGNDATFNVVNTFSNTQANIYANNDLTIQKFATNNVLYNAGDNKTASVVNSAGTIETESGDISIAASSVSNITNTNLTQNITSIQDVRSDSLWVLITGGRLVYSIGGSTDNIKTATIQSGNTFSLDVNTLTNNSGSIYSKGNISINSIGNISNSGNQFITGTKTFIFGNMEWPYYDFDLYQHAVFTEDQTQSYSYPSLIKSGGTISVTQNGSSVSSFVNGNNIAQYVSVGTLDNPSPSATYINKIDTYQLSQSGIINIDLSSISEAINSNNGSNNYAPDITFSGNFKINLDPRATTPLVESRSQFTDISKFFGSVYYFNQLGLNGTTILAEIDRQNLNASATRMLGDSFVETKLIFDQLKALTNDSLLLSQSTEDTNQQIKELLDNSISELTRLGLNAGDVAVNGLNKSQITSLTKDIVTFESTKVNGISVLSPKLYLSSSTRNRLLGSDNSLATSSSIFAQGDLTIDSPFANVSNNGSIVSNGNLTMNVGSLENSSAILDSSIVAVSKIKSLGDLTIAANSTAASVTGISIKNSLLDSAGKISISANNNIAIANDKNFSIATLTTSSSSSSSISTSAIKDDAATSRSALAFNATSDIEINSLGDIDIANNYFNTGGSIFMTASNDINNSNYTISASDNVVMSATNINNIHTSNNDSETRIEAGNIVSIDATNDINNIGATIKGGSLVYLTAGNDINNLALVDYSINGSAITESQALTSDARNISSSLVAQGNIESEGDLVMVAANDINNKGSNIISSDASYLEATNGNINITAAALRNKTYAEGGSRKKHWVSIADNITNIESSISSGDALDLLASGTASTSTLASEIGNINITGSKLSSAEDMTLSAKNDISISSAQDTTYNFSAGRSGRGKSYLNRASSTTQVESELSTTNNGNITITSGLDNTDVVGASDSYGSISLIASKLITQDSDSDSSNNSGSGNITLAAKEDLTISSALDSKYSESFASKKSRTVKKTSSITQESATNISSEINATGDITTTSGSDTNIIASTITGAGNGDITVGAYSDTDTTSATFGQILYNDEANLNILSATDFKKFYSESTKEKTGLSLENAVMTAAMMAAILVAGPGAAALATAGGGLAVGGAAAIGSVNKQKTTKTELHYDETVISSQLNFANDLTLSAMNDITLQAAKIEAEGNVTINAANNLAITTATESHQTSYELKDKGNYFSKNGNSGNVNTNIINTEITSNGGENSNLTFNVGNATVAQYNKSSGDNSSGTTKTGLDGSILYGDFSTNQKLTYLESLDSATTLYNPIEEINKSWDQTTRGLTAAGQAVVAITATALTAGAMDPVNGSILQGFLVAGSSAAASTATVAIANSAVNADGDIFKQLKTISKDTWDTTTSKESVKNIVIAAAAGGLAVGLTNFTSTGSFTTSANTTSSISNNANTFERVSTNLKNSFQEVATQTLASTAAESAINGDSFTDAIKAQGKNILIYTVAKVGANEIGRAYHGTQTTLIDSSGKPLTNLDGSVMTSPQIGKVTQLTLHAALGCGVSSTSGGNCVSGAAAGVIGELVARPTFDGLNENSRNSDGKISNEQFTQNRKSAIQISGFSGSLASLLTSVVMGQSDQQIADNIFSGQRIGGNAAENNSIKVKAQPVRFGFDHTLVYHEPEPGDQKYFTADPRYDNINPKTGNRYMTLGGGPDNAKWNDLGNLIGDVNRKYDVLTQNKIYESPNLVTAESDIHKASLLYWSNQAYKDNLPYQLFPSQTGNGYNSNSYASGLLESVGIASPVLPGYVSSSTPWQDIEYPERSPSIYYPLPLSTPGYNKPVPKEYFGVKL